MKIVISISKEVKNCSDCPALYSHSGHGENFETCTHPENERG